MDKNNDVPVNKVNKWDYGVVDMSLWHLKDEFDALVDKLNGVYSIDVFEIEELTADTRSSLDKVLDRFNELEASHQKDTGMISEYEEENRNLKSELDIKTDECDALISRVFKQDDEYTKLKEENEELRCELVADNDKLRRDRDRNAYLLDGLCRTLADKGIFCEWDERALKWHLYDEISTCTSCRQHYKSEIKQIIELVKSYGLAIYDDRKDAMPDDVVTVGMCGHYYVLGGCSKEESKDIQKLEKKIEMLEKENKVLKDTIEKDGEFGRNVGKRVADSIREGCDKGVYKLHPYTRIDIHVEQITDMPFAFNHCAIPRISVIFNNTQTEMERDTAQHECEELEKKFKELVKENEDLRTTFALCERDANMARELCHTIAFNAERAKNKTPWFNE